MSCAKILLQVEMETGTDDERIYPVSLKIMVEQGYLDKLMDFRSWNPETEQQFVHIREKMHAYCLKQNTE